MSHTIIRGSFAIAATLLLFASPLIARAQSEQEIRDKFLYRSYTHITSSNDTLTGPYRLFIPDDYNPAIKYPIVMAFHGRGEAGDDNETHIARSRLATAWADPTNQQRHSAFVVAPQAPADFNGPFYRGMNPHERAVGLLDSLMSEFSIDPDRVYVTGLSMGGDFTFMLITERPDLFAAAVPIAATTHVVEKADQILNIPLWIYHARNDDTIPVEHSRIWIRELEKLGLTPFYPECYPNGICQMQSDCARNVGASNRRLIYTEFPSGGHTIWDDAYNDPVMIDWVFDQKRGKSTISRVGSTLSLDVDANSILNQDPNRSIGILGNRYPLHNTDPTTLCEDIGENVFGASISFPDTTIGVLEYKYVHVDEGGGNVTAESLTGGTRQVVLDGSKHVLPVVFWNNENERLPEAPVLVAPDIGALLLGNALLTWTPGQFTGRYHVEVDTNTAFNAPQVKESGLRDARLSISGLDESKTFHWRVRAENVFGFSPWSDSHSFYMLGQAPLLLSPEDGSESGSGIVTLQWHRYPGAVAYYIEVSTTSDFLQSEEYQAVFATSRELPLDYSTTYFWRVRDARSTIWSETWSFETPEGTHVEQTETPRDFLLYPNYPNPFNPTTSIRFDLPRPEYVQLTVYNVIGQEVGRLVDGQFSATSHEVAWDASAMPTGLYFYTMKAGTFLETKTMILVK